MGLLSALGGLVGIGANLFNANSERKEQRKFAQNAIQWKVADATKAGLHPLAALGANTMSYSPVQVGDMAGPLADMGQNVERSMEATRNGTERAAGQLGALQLERAGLENDLLRSQIASQNAQLRAQVGPPMPTDGQVGQVIPGQGNSLEPSKVVPPQLTKGYNLGKRWESNPYFSDAQTFEDRFGDAEIPSTLNWMLNSAADYYWNNFAKKDAPFPGWKASAMKRKYKHW